MKRGLRPVSRIDAASSGMMSRERDVEPVVGEEAREACSPRAAADDDRGSHDRRRKSIATGTPSSANRSRSSFSTQ